MEFFAPEQQLVCQGALGKSCFIRTKEVIFDLNPEGKKTLVKRIRKDGSREREIDLRNSKCKGLGAEMSWFRKREQKEVT